MIVGVNKASPTIKSEPVEDLQINIQGEMPAAGTLKAQAELYNEQGEFLARCLWNSLPGGTLDALIGALLKKRASLFRVTFGDTGE